MSADSRDSHLKEPSQSRAEKKKDVEVAPPADKHAPSPATIVEEDDTEEDIQLKYAFIQYVRSKAPPEFFTSWTDEQRSAFADARLAEFTELMKEKEKEETKFREAVEYMQKEFPKFTQDREIFNVDTWVAGLTSETREFVHFSNNLMQSHAGTDLASFPPCALLDFIGTTIETCARGELPKRSKDEKASANEDRSVVGSTHHAVPTIFREAFAYWLSGESSSGKASTDCSEVGSCSSCVTKTAEKIDDLYPEELRKLADYGRSQPIPGCFRFRLFTDDFCKRLSQVLLEAEAFAKEHKLALRGPNSMNKYGMLLAAIGLEQPSNFLVGHVMQLLNTWTLPYMVFQRGGGCKTCAESCACDVRMSTGDVHSKTIDCSGCSSSHHTDHMHYHAASTDLWKAIPIDSHYAFSVHYLAVTAAEASVHAPTDLPAEEEEGEKDKGASQHGLPPRTNLEAALERVKSENADRLALHVDSADMTLNVCLGIEGFEGGSLILEGVRCQKHAQDDCTALPSGSEGKSSSTPQQRFVDDAPYTVHNSIGYAFIHHGQHRHRALPITAGERINLVVWANCSGLRDSLVHRREGPALESCVEYCGRYRRTFDH